MWQRSELCEFPDKAYKLQCSMFNVTLFSIQFLTSKFGNNHPNNFVLCRYPLCSNNSLSMRPKSIKNKHKAVISWSCVAHQLNISHHQSATLQSYSLNLHCSIPFNHQQKAEGSIGFTGSQQTSRRKLHFKPVVLNTSALTALGYAEHKT